jgi:molybdopterin adenylyltransferase
MLRSPTSALVITVSDRCARGEQPDVSGPAVAQLLREHGFAVESPLLVPDEQPLLEQLLLDAAARAPLVVTTGGTGITPRDVTPEATRAVCRVLLDGLPELMRAEGRRETPFAVLSRGLCGLLGDSLVINLPGAPRGAVTSLAAVLPVVPHVLGLAADPAASHPAQPAEASTR